MVCSSGTITPMSPPDGLIVPTKPTMAIHSRLSPVERDAGRGHQNRAGQQQVAQLIARRQHADAERQKRRAEQRRGRHDADLKRAEAKPDQIGRQHDGGEAVAKTAHAARDQQKTGYPIVGGAFRPRAISSNSSSVAQSLDGRRLKGSLRFPVIQLRSTMRLRSRRTFLFLPRAGKGFYNELADIVLQALTWPLLKPFEEPALALLRGAVGEGIRHHIALRLLLQRGRRRSPRRSATPHRRRRAPGNCACAGHGWPRRRRGNRPAARCAPAARWPRPCSAPPAASASRCGRMPSSSWT